MDNATNTNLKTCKTCSDKTCLKPGKDYGKPCDDVEVVLREEKIKGRNWIRPKTSGHKRDGHRQFREIPFSSLDASHLEYIKKKTGETKESLNL